MTHEFKIIISQPESEELSDEELESSLESSELDDSFDFFDLVDFVEP